MKCHNHKIIWKENYMKRDKIGEDLFFNNQVVINTDTDEWTVLSFKSNVFLKLLLSGNNFYHPHRFINIHVVDV